MFPDSIREFCKPEEYFCQLAARFEREQIGILTVKQEKLGIRNPREGA